MKIGWPEGRIPLAETTIYLATSPKSNSAYSAINDALELVRSTGNLPVPLHLRNAPTKLMKQLGYGQEYKYAHSYEGSFIRAQFLRLHKMFYILHHHNGIIHHNTDGCH